MNSHQFTKQIRHFKPSEFSEWIGYGHPKLFCSLDEFRRILGCRIFPSPAPGALARFDWSDRKSQHFCDYQGPRLSKAVDVFPDCQIEHAFIMAMCSQLFGGVGVYFDTFYNGKKWPMLHLDIRDIEDVTLIWFRHQHNDYRYPQYCHKDMRLLISLFGRQYDPK